MKKIADYSTPETSNAIRATSKSLRDAVPPRLPYGYYVNDRFHRVEDRTMTANEISLDRGLGEDEWTVSTRQHVYRSNDKIDLAHRPHLVFTRRITEVMRLEQDDQDFRDRTGAYEE